MSSIRIACRRKTPFSCLAEKITGALPRHLSTLRRTALLSRIRCGPDVCAGNRPDATLAHQARDRCRFRHGASQHIGCFRRHHQVRRDTAITGKFRMVSDNPAAQWRTDYRYQCIPRARQSAAAERRCRRWGTSGRFVLRNAFGPRVLRAAYTLAGGESLVACARFAERERHHRRSHGLDRCRSERTPGIRVHSGSGPVERHRRRSKRPRAWVLVVAADQKLWQPSVTTSGAVQAVGKGAFALARGPGRYLVKALSPTAFWSAQEALRKIVRFAPGGMVVELADRETKTITLTLEETVTQ